MFLLTVARGLNVNEVSTGFISQQKALQSVVSNIVIFQGKDRKEKM